MKGTLRHTEPQQETLPLFCSHQNISGDTEHCSIRANERSMTETVRLLLQPARRTFSITLKIKVIQRWTNIYPVITTHWSDKWLGLELEQQWGAACSFSHHLFWGTIDKTVNSNIAISVIEITSQILTAPFGFCQHRFIHKYLAWSNRTV